MLREIKRKTLTYGIAAVLLAFLLTATVYNFGVQLNVPQEPGSPPEPEVPSEPSGPSDPNVPPQPSVPSEPDVPSVLSELKTFSSYEELVNFLNINMETAKQFQNHPRFTALADDQPEALEVVSLLVPQGWAMRGLSLAMDGKTVPEMLPVFGVILLWSLVFTGIGQYKMQRRFA